MIFGQVWPTNESKRNGFLSMPLSSEILQAAQELGEALRETETIGAFLAADRQFHSDLTLHRLAEEVEKRRADIHEKERSWQVLSPTESNQFHNLLDQLHRSPKFIEREERLRAAQFTLAQTAEVLSSVLSVQYAGLVNEDAGTGCCGQD